MKPGSNWLGSSKLAAKRPAQEGSREFVDRFELTFEGFAGFSAAAI